MRLMVTAWGGGEKKKSRPRRKLGAQASSAGVILSTSGQEAPSL